MDAEKDAKMEVGGGRWDQRSMLLAHIHSRLVQEGKAGGNDGSIL